MFHGLYELDKGREMLSLFRFTHKSGKRRILPALKPYACRRCAHIDVRQIAQKGLLPSIQVPSAPRDIFDTIDVQMIISRRFMELLEGQGSLPLEFYELPMNSGLFLTLPKRVFSQSPSVPRSKEFGVQLIPGHPFVSYFGPCNECKRVADGSFNCYEFSVPDDVTIAGISMRFGGYSWVISDGLAKAIDSAQLIGVGVGWEMYPKTGPLIDSYEELF